MQIVPYSPEYRDEITELLREFYDDSLNEYGLEMTGTIDRLEKSLVGFVLLVKDKAVGIMAGVITGQLMASKVVFQEVLWYVHKAHRGKGLALLSHLETWCEDNGVDNIVMAYTHNSGADRLLKLYERRGYKPFETHLIRNVNHG